MSNVNEKLEALKAANRKKAEPKPKETIKAAVEDALGGVTVGWLAGVFQMDVRDVKTRLADCPTTDPGKATANGVRGRKYALKDAAQYLVKPKISHADFLRSIKKGDLPPSMQNAFWTARLAEQKWMENAGDLWRTNRVREVLGGTFQTLKFTIQLWEDTLDQEKALTKEQRDSIRRMSDNLQGELFKSLVQQMEGQGTGSQLDEYDKLIGDADEKIRIEMDSVVEAENDENDDPEADALI